jgi:integrase
MSGHVRQRSAGSFEVRYRVEGRVCTETVRGGKKAAQSRLRELMTAADKGQHVDRSAITVAEWTSQRIAVWSVSERTRENYRNLAKLICAHLGGLQLQKLQTMDVEKWHVELRGLAPSTLRAAHRLLVRALADAVHHRLLTVNVAREQPPPRAPGRRVQVPTEAAIAPMLKALRGSEFFAPVMLTLYTGMRRGETLALRWSDLDLDGGTLRVERSLEETSAGISFKAPKTESGERTISLSAAAVDALREHRRSQLELRLALGAGRPPDDALVFPRLDGQPQSPNAFSVAWIRTVKRLGLPKLTWHGLRHLSASLLLRHGVDLATASRRLGHSRPDTTARLYLHSIAENDRHAAAALERALQ